MDTKMLVILAMVMASLAVNIDRSSAQIPEEKNPCIIDGCNVGERIEPKVLDRHQFTWNLFYKMMTAAFIVGAVVQGVLVFVTFRFRERKQKEVKR